MRPLARILWALGAAGSTLVAAPTPGWARGLASSISVVSSGPEPSPAPTVPDLVRLADDLGQRRAIRGSILPPAALLGSGTESAELRALRELDESELIETSDGQPTTLPPDLKQPDVPVAWQPRVMRYVDYFTKDQRGRAIMGGWLKAEGRYRDLIDGALRRAHLPTAIRYVSMIESSFNTYDHTSGAGAMGLWQFLPENGRIYGLRIDGWVDERRDPERATVAFTRYIGDLKTRFGSWPLTLAAFNAGYGAVLRAMQKYNTNDYWELCGHEDGLPWETVLYVPKMMAVALIGENRARFGFGGDGDNGWRFDRVTVSTSVGLPEAASWTGATVAELERLNPTLRRDRTPPGESWSLRMPVGAAAKFAARYDPRHASVRAYTLRFGERLDDVARALGMHSTALRALNGLDNKASESELHGTIVVPTDAVSRAPSGDEVRVVSLPDLGLRVAGRRRLFFHPRADDSLRDIAAFFHVTVGELSSWNRVDAGASVAGLVLQVWVAPSFDDRSAVLVDPRYVRLVALDSDEFFDLMERRKGRVRLHVTAKKGDSWAKVAARYGLTVADLERINRLASHERPLKSGDHLIVYRAMTDSERREAQKLDASPLAEVRAETPMAPVPVVAAPATDTAAPTDDDDSISDDDLPMEKVAPLPPPPPVRASDSEL